MNITWYIYVELLCKPNIEETKVFLVVAPNKPTWKDDFVTYLLEGKLSKDKVEPKNYDLELWLI